MNDKVKCDDGVWRRPVKSIEILMREFGTLAENVKNVQTMEDFEAVSEQLQELIGDSLVHYDDMMEDAAKQMKLLKESLEDLAGKSKGEVKDSADEVLGMLDFIADSEDAEVPNHEELKEDIAAVRAGLSQMSQSGGPGVVSEPPLITFGELGASPGVGEINIREDTTDDGALPDDVADALLEQYFPNRFP